MFTQHDHSLSSVSGVWLQPSVTTIVSSATGSIIADHLSPERARMTVVICYILWGVGFFPALLIMANYFLRLAVHKVRPSFFTSPSLPSTAFTNMHQPSHQCPPNALVVSTFLPLGPCGQGGFALLRLSAVVRKLCLQSTGTTGMYSAADLRVFGNAVYAGTIPYVTLRPSQAII